MLKKHIRDKTVQLVERIQDYLDAKKYLKHKNSKHAVAFNNLTISPRPESKQEDVVNTSKAKPILRIASSIVARASHQHFKKEAALQSPKAQQKDSVLTYMEHLSSSSSSNSLPRHNNGCIPDENDEEADANCFCSDTSRD